MSHEPILYPVARVYRFEGGPPWPWSWSDTDPPQFDHVRLSAETTLAEVGSVAATVVHLAQLEVGPTAREWLDGLLEFAPFSVDGGVAASDGGREIGPSCCCSVSGWTEWETFLTAGDAPWMGHDPTGWAEWVGDVARVWRDGGYHREAKGFALDFPRERFAEQVANVARQLSGFLDRVEEWARSLGCARAGAVRQAFA